jgi:predicted Zn-dependent peptidase
MPAPATEARVVEVSELSNGIHVISEPMARVRSVSIGIWIGSGSRVETSPEMGITHFLEHMLFKGTASRSAEDIARTVDAVGGHLDAYTAKELVSYSIKVIGEHVPLAFDVLTDLVLHPVMREEDIEREKGVILEELKMEVDNPEYLVHETFIGRFWQGHPLGNPIIGTRKTIKSFDQKALRGYHQRIYRPHNLLVTAAGHIDHETVVRMAEERLGPLACGIAEPSLPPPSTHAEVSYRKKRIQQVHICLGVPAHPLAHESRHACYLLNTVLGGGMSSRLFQNIREKQGLAYSVFSELNLFRDTGCLAVYAGTAKEHSSRLIRSVIEEFRQLKTVPVPAEELRRAKDHLKGSLMLSLESTSSRMANLARQFLYFRRFFTLDELLASIEAVTLGEIQQLAAECFDTSKIALTVLGSPDGEALGREALVC